MSPERTVLALMLAAVGGGGVGAYVAGATYAAFFVGLVLFWLGVWVVADA